MQSPDWRLGLRQHVRHKVFQPATLRVEEAQARVHILDVSQSGVRLHSTMLLGVGASVTLQWCGGERRSARIAWSDTPRYGVEFGMPLDERQVDDLLTAA